MNKFFRFALLFASVALCASACNDDDDNTDKDTIPVAPPAQKGWVMDWEYRFANGYIDPTVWSRIPRGTPDWANTQTTNDAVYEATETSLKLLGIANDDVDPTDSSPYLTGGIWTTGLKAFVPPFRVEVHARMTGCQGSWPAIWMMPWKGRQGWPYDGEIDIMERLNTDASVYQTAHSGWTYTDGKTGNPKNSEIAYVGDCSQYHTYGVEVNTDAIRWFIDGVKTHEYRRLFDDPTDPNYLRQYPFYHNWVLYIDNQLGGSWVGPVDPAGLPVELEVDWVKSYQFGELK